MQHGKSTQETKRKHSFLCILVFVSFFFASSRISIFASLSRVMFVLWSTQNRWASSDGLAETRNVRVETLTLRECILQPLCREFKEAEHGKETKGSKKEYASKCLLAIPLPLDKTSSELKMAVCRTSCETTASFRALFHLARQPASRTNSAEADKQKCFPRIPQCLL